MTLKSKLRQLAKSWQFNIDQGVYGGTSRRDLAKIFVKEMLCVVDWHRKTTSKRETGS